MSLHLETGQSLRDYVLVEHSPERIRSLINRRVKSANADNPQHGTIKEFAVWNDTDEFFIEWDDGKLSLIHI